MVQRCLLFFGLLDVLGTIIIIIHSVSYHLSDVVEFPRGPLSPLPSQRPLACFSSVHARGTPLGSSKHIRDEMLTPRYRRLIESPTWFGWCASVLGASHRSSPAMSSRSALKLYNYGTATIPCALRRSSKLLFPSFVLSMCVCQDRRDLCKQLLLRTHV